MSFFCFKLSLQKKQNKTKQVHGKKKKKSEKKMTDKIHDNVVFFPTDPGMTELL